MKKLTWLLLVVAALVTARAVMAQTADRAALRAQLERRFDIVPLSDGIALRPKSREGDLRLIEVTAGSVLVNGSAVTGRELRDRLGADADAVLRLSYLLPSELRAIMEPVPPQPPAAPLPPAGPDDQPPLERAPSQQAEEHRWPNRSRGDRIRIFGDVTVNRDEEITGQVVAVFGTAHVNGKVRDQVVAVLGSVLLGENAVVDGDVVSVGGRVHRKDGAQTRGSVTEVAVGRIPLNIGLGPSGMHDVPFVSSFGAVPGLVMTLLRLSLLLLLTGIAFIVARRAVEVSADHVSEHPIKVTVVGLVAEALVIPVLVLTAIVLSISIIGIPLLLLLPFVVVGLILMALVGFTGAAAAIGGFVQRQFPGSRGYLAVAVGVLVVLSPVLIARLVAFGGWPLTPFSVVLMGLGFAFELLVWAGGFGAMLITAFTRWQARRGTQTAPVTV